MPQPDVSTLARIAAVRFENGIRSDALENCALIASDGRMVVSRVGKADHVHLTSAELVGAGQGATLAHNHPGGFGPSLDDVLLGAEFGLHEVRVVTATHRHGVSQLSVRHIQPLNQSFAAEEARAINATRDDVRKGHVNPIDFSIEVRHRTWLRLSASIGFHYWRERS